MGGPALHQKKCVPCEGGVPRLSAPEAKILLKNLAGWKLQTGARSIRTELRLNNFREALKLLQAIGRVAEAENHHPDLHLTRYRFLAVVLTTHAIRGLSLNDFIVAAKIQNLFKKLPPPGL